MKEQTLTLKQLAQKSKDLQEKVDLLKDAYKGEKCFLLTCGPSIKNFSSDYLQNKLKDSLVISVKQTYNLVPGLVDFHLLNAWNYQLYKYKKPKPIVLMEKAEHEPDTPGIQYDLLFNIVGVKRGIPREIRLQNRLCTKKNFDEYLFEKTLDRPWGPGIVYELGFYLAVHIGASEIITLGWDIGEIGSREMPHFFDKNNPQSLTTPRDLLSRKKGIASIVNNLMVKLKFFINKDQRLYNQPGFYEGEVLDIANSTKDVYYWLQSKGIKLQVISDRSLADNCIPRTTL